MSLWSLLIIGIAVCLACLLVQAALLAVGVRLFKIGRIGFRRALAAVGLLLLVQLPFLAASLLATAHLPSWEAAFVDWGLTGALFVAICFTLKRWLATSWLRPSRFISSQPFSRRRSPLP